MIVMMGQTFEHAGGELEGEEHPVHRAPYGAENGGPERVEGVGVEEGEEEEGSVYCEDEDEEGAEAGDDEVEDADEEKDDGEGDEGGIEYS